MAVITRSAPERHDESTAETTLRAPVESGGRLLYLDRLRIWLTMEVVLHHVAMAFGAGGLAFYYVDLPDAIVSRNLLVFVLVNQAWFMGAFFLVAGYFTPGSLDRKGTAAFLRSRLIRLGIPLVVFTAVLNPIAMTGWFHVDEQLGPMTWDTFDYVDTVRMGPTWFLALLLIFSFGYALWRMVVGPRVADPAGGSFPGLLWILAFVVVLAATEYLLRMVLIIGESWGGFPSLAYLPQYLGMFVVGTIASQRGWLRSLPATTGIVGLVAAAAATVVLFPLAFSGEWFSMELTEALNDAMGDGTWQSAVYAAWDAALVVGLSLGLIVVLRATAHREGALGRFLTDTSYGTYIVHIPIVVYTAVLVGNTDLSHTGRLILTAVIAVPVSFLAAAAVSSIPGADHVLGSRRQRRRRQTASAHHEPGPTHGEVAIETSDLGRTFGEFEAVKGVNLSVRRGELFSLLGPNGAGKTTTIRMLCCLLQPSGGSARVAGFDTEFDPIEVKRRVAVSPQETAVAEHLNAWENLSLMARLHGFDREKTRRRSEELLEMLGLSGRADERVKNYSGGMKRRLSIAMALVSDPEVLFLDEPTLGLDPQSRRGLWEHIEKLKGQITIVLTTHYLEEADALADRIAIIDGGEVVALGTPDELKELVPDGQTTVIEAEVDDKALNALRDRFGSARRCDGSVVVDDPDIDLEDVIDVLRPLGVEVHASYRNRVTLDDVFVHLTGRQLRE
ncbi:MAG: ATP-binding cassette domain-containing protein [Acidimicrobiia bacterium]|nr:ATP-binding cassette domain-containing protein [Acidimicrobiia bacterium]